MTKRFSFRKVLEYILLVEKINIFNRDVLGPQHLPVLVAPALIYPEILKRDFTVEDLVSVHGSIEPLSRVDEIDPVTEQEITDLEVWFKSAILDAMGDSTLKMYSTRYRRFHDPGPRFRILEDLEDGTLSEQAVADKLSIGSTVASYRQSIIEKELAANLNLMKRVNSPQEAYEEFVPLGSAGRRQHWRNGSVELVLPEGGIHIGVRPDNTMLTWHHAFIKNGMGFTLWSSKSKEEIVDRFLGRVSCTCTDITMFEHHVYVTLSHNIR